MSATRQADARLASEFAGCLATSTRMLDRAVTTLYDEALKPHGVRSTQLSILATVASLGSPTAADLVPALCIDQTTLSRAIERLVERGLLRSDADPDDARQRRLGLTRKGRTALREALPAWKRSQVRLRELLGAPLCDRLVAGAARVAVSEPNP